MWWLFEVLLALYGLYCLVFLATAIYTAYVDYRCGTRQRPRGYTGVPPDATDMELEPMLRNLRLSDISHNMKRKKDGYIMNMVVDPALDVSRSNPPIIPYSDAYGDGGGPIFF